MPSATKAVDSFGLMPIYSWDLWDGVGVNRRIEGGDAESVSRLESAMSSYERQKPSPRRLRCRRIAEHGSTRHYYA